MKEKISMCNTKRKRTIKDIFMIMIGATLLVAVLTVMLTGCGNVNETKAVSESETDNCTMPASYQSSLTNRFGSKVKVYYEDDWTDSISNGRAIADCNNEIKGISIDTENSDLEGKIVYQVHEVSGSWLTEQENGKESLSSDSSINAVKVKLAGQCADKYNVFTKVYQDNKWSEWELNGNTTGDENGAPIRGICVEIREKTEGIPEFYIRDVDTDQKMIALTFDDSPSDEQTDILLDILEQYDARATFFVIGESVNEDRADTMKRIITEGSEIGIHTYSHDNLTEISKEEVASTCAKCSWMIESTTNYRPVVMRAPGGNCNEEALNVLGTLDLPNVLWSVDSQDWKKKDSESIVDRILKDVSEGSIILAHDTKESTVEAMKIVIPELVARGYQFMTVSELFAYNGGICVGKQYSQPGEADEPSNEEEGFNDVCVFRNDDEQVTFCGVDFDGSDKSLTLNFACDNFTEETRKFIIYDIEINGKSYGTNESLGALDKGASEVFEYLIANIPESDYYDITDVRFVIRIDDGNNTELAQSQTVHVVLDTKNETVKPVTT